MNNSQYDYQYGSGTRDIILPSDLSNLFAWYRFDIGILVNAQGVFEWSDQSGNGNDLIQTGFGNKPTHELDGSILFDGTNERLKLISPPFNHPLTVFLLAEPDTWTIGKYTFDGATANTCGLANVSTSPNVIMLAGSNGPATNLFTVGQYSIITAVFNGSSSILQVNLNAPSFGSPGNDDPDGFLLGGRGDSTLFSHFRAKECVLVESAVVEPEITGIVNYLNQVGGGSVF